MAGIDEQLKAIQQIPSRFERLLTPSNILDDMVAMKRTVRGTNTALISLNAKVTPQRAVRGTVRGDPMFEALLFFSEVIDQTPEHKNANWTEPLVEPLGNTEYYVRIQISQHQINPLLQGFTTRWVIPAGWSLSDGQGAVVHDEAISNPLYINRRVHSPGGKPPRVGFRVVIDARYRS
jgi:hypothetical protein